MAVSYKTKVDENGRECTKCGEYKLRNEFAYTGGNKKTGHSSSCKKCNNLATKQIYNGKNK